MPKYIYNKLRILKHFGVSVSESDLQHALELPSEVAIDNWGRSMIMRGLAQ